MNEYLLNPDVCPSSLNENDEPMNMGETAHKWDMESGTCNECGGTLTQKAKIALLPNAIKSTSRPDGTMFSHFTDDAPESLKQLFLEHYEVADLDYQTFGEACELVSEIYADEPDANAKKVEEMVYERSGDRASYYTSDRLAYLSPSNEGEISDIMRDYGMHSISEACAAWYDKQVEQQAILIKDWVNA